MNDQTYLRNLYDEEKVYNQATNVWLSADIVNDSLKNHQRRGSSSNTYYNMFVRVTGVEDKKEYQKELFNWKTELEKAGKKVLLLEEILPATFQEVEKLEAKNYISGIQMIRDLSRKIRCPYPKLLNQVTKVFVDFLVEESANTSQSFEKLRVKAIQLVCWFSRYGKDLFNESYEANLPVLIYFGTCRNATEAMFLKFFASLPIDVIVINPNKTKACTLTDSRLFDQTFDNSLDLEKFPKDLTDYTNGTVAYFAERDLDELLYQDSGLYRDFQFSKAVALPLKTMYEEIYLLWNEEIRQRPNFQIIENSVVMPTITAKVCGIKDGNIEAYWKDVSKLLGENTVFIKEVYFYNRETEDFDTTYALKNGKLQKQNIIRNAKYRYGIYREEIQEYMLNKLEELLENDVVSSSFAREDEDKIIKVIMNLDINIARLIQNMDFTKRNPKLVLVNTSEMEYNVEESIVLAYLRLIGFDIVIFVPTGYRVIEKYFSQKLFTEYVIGDFIHDLIVPNRVSVEHREDEKDTFFGKIQRKMKKN